MRSLIYPVLAILLISAHKVNAQVDTVFFNTKWKLTKNRDSFAYFRPAPVMKDGRYEVRDYFLNGTLQMVGHYSADAKNLMSDDNLADEYQDGRFEYYHENGKLKQEGVHDRGKRIGTWTYYYMHGGVKSTTLHKNGKLQGRYTAYDSVKGMPLYTGMYKNDMGVGTWTFFYSGTKQVKSELTFKEDNLNGNAVYYDSLSGNKLNSGLFRNNKRVGRWDIYDRATGKLMGGEDYVEGKKHGESFYYTLGTKQKWLLAHYVDDTLHGELATYYESGKIKRREFYSLGQSISSACYDQKGEQIECLPLVVEGRFNGDIMTYIGEHLRYPEQAKKNRLEGKVVISFILSKTGLIQNPVVSSGFDTACDAEALRLIAQMPQWEPHYIDGIPIEIVKSLPVVFWLPEEEAPAASN